MIDWQVGYDPPSVTVKRWLEKVLAGDETVASLQARLKKDPRDIETVTRLGKKYQDRSDDEKAVGYFAAALKLSASGARGDIMYGLVKVPCAEFSEFALAEMAILSRSRDSLAKMREFTKKYPVSPLAQAAYTLLGNFYGYYGERAAAEEFFESYMARFPESPQPYRNYARRILKDGGDAKKAEELLQRALQADRTQAVGGGFGLSIADYAKAAELQGDPVRAAEVFDLESLQLRARIFSTEVHYFLNFWLDQNILKDQAEKFADLTAAMAEYPHFLQNSADIYLRLGKTDKAMSIMGPAFAAKNWDNAGNLWSYASYWEKKGQNLDDALKAARRSVELPDESACFYWGTLSDLLLKFGNREEALRAAEKALELAPADYSAPFKARVTKIKGLMKRP